MSTTPPYKDKWFWIVFLFLVISIFVGGFFTAMKFMVFKECYLGMWGFRF